MLLDPDSIGCGVLAAIGLVFGVLAVVAIRRRQPPYPPAASVLRRTESFESWANPAIDLVGAVHALAERLSAGGVVVARWMVDYSAFGCWSLDLQNPDLRHGSR